MIAEGHQLAVLVQAGREVMVAARPEHVVLDVLRARPQQLDRRAVELRDHGRLGHVFIRQAPAEAAAAASHVELDVRFRDAERLGDELDARAGVLCRRPDFNLAVLERSGAVLRLQRHMRQERIVIAGFDDRRRAGERALGISIGADDLRRCFLGKLERILRGIH